MASIACLVIHIICGFLPLAELSKNVSAFFVNQEGAVSTNVQTLISEETDNLKIQLFWWENK